MNDRLFGYGAVLLFSVKLLGGGVLFEELDSKQDMERVVKLCLNLKLANEPVLVIGTTCTKSAVFEHLNDPEESIWVVNKDQTDIALVALRLIRDATTGLMRMDSLLQERSELQNIYRDFIAFISSLRETDSRFADLTWLGFPMEYRIDSDMIFAVGDFQYAAIELKQVSIRDATSLQKLCPRYKIGFLVPTASIAVAIAYGVWARLFR